MAKKRKKNSGSGSSAVQRRAQIQAQAQLQSRSQQSTSGANAGGVQGGNASPRASGTTGAPTRSVSTSTARSSTRTESTSRPSSSARQPQRRYTRQRISGRTRWLIVAGALVVVLAIIGGFIFLSQQHSSPGARGGTDPEVLNTITRLDANLLAQIGTGGQKNPLQAVTNRDRLVGPHGKPEVFYWGAEFCPYCAAERWSLVVALSRFGHFSALPETTSSSSDVYPDTATFTFYGSSYTSSYIDFVPLEVEDRNQQPLQTPNQDQQQLVNALNPSGGFPFLDIANIYMSQGQTVDPGLLSGLSQKDIAIQMTNSSTSISKSILGVANYLTAGICVATNDQPASVCKASFIQTIEKQLPRLALARSDSVAVNLTSLSEGLPPTSSSRPRSGSRSI
ncbi:MAG: DUF929 family protein [Thermogemmatispora sp.]|uniref:DUF929 family protein n=1 Tax=Thermogemmatispora sp. TaxID=1968838 RepID=UPI001A0A0507|nr:DUF929 family protein [Thermogemmatispora sp.]MBE3564585.1 DUF929 family protein [Thermogemmatispora sp.]